MVNSKSTSKSKVWSLSTNRFGLRLLSWCFDLRYTTTFQTQFISLLEENKSFVFLSLRWSGGHTEMASTLTVKKLKNVNQNWCLPSFELDFFELSTSDRSLTSSIVMDTDQVKNMTLYSGFYSVVFIKYTSLKYAHMKHNMPSTYHNKCY